MYLGDHDFFLVMNLCYGVPLALMFVKDESMQRSDVHVWWSLHATCPCP